MAELKLRILNQFGSPQILSNPDEIEVHFPYQTDDSLVKRMSYNSVRILNSDFGEIAVELTDFEVQGLIVAEKQNFSVKIIHGTKVKEAIFENALNVRTIDINGEQRKVIFKK